MDSALLDHPKKQGLGTAQWTTDYGAEIAMIECDTIDSYDEFGPETGGHGLGYKFKREARSERAKRQAGVVVHRIQTLCSFDSPTDEGQGETAATSTKWPVAGAQKTPRAEKANPAVVGQAELQDALRKAPDAEATARLLIAFEFHRDRPEQPTSPALLREFRTYLGRHVATEEPVRRTAVASAIRLWVADLSRERLSEVADLLENGANGILLGPTIELELLKMLTRVLLADPARVPDHTRPSLRGAVRSVLRTYVHPKLLGWGTFRPAARQAALAAALLQNEDLPERLDQWRETSGLETFADSVTLSLRKMARDLTRNGQTEAAAAVAVLAQVPGSMPELAEVRTGSAG